MERENSIMESSEPIQDASVCCEGGSCGGALPRREFLSWAGTGALAGVLPSMSAMAGPFTAQDFEALVPHDKKLRPDWVKSLYERGKPEVYSGSELRYVGMPVGGIACGQLYLGGDGRLWYWDIFRSFTSTDYAGKVWAGLHYETPLPAEPNVTQGFAVRVHHRGKVAIRTLDHKGFPKVTFRGEYPVGRVHYAADDFPVEIGMEAFSPFIPLNVEDSSLPATILSFTLKNTTAEKIEVDLAGWLENAVCRYGDSGLKILRLSRVVQREGQLGLSFEAEQVPDDSVPRKEVVFEDFENGYGDWTVEGEAFGKEPAAGTLAGQQEVSGFTGSRLVNSFHGGDNAKGRLLSKPFVLSRKRISFLIGGGSRPNEACMNLLIDGKIVRTATGQNAEALIPAFWSVQEFEGKTAQIEIVDNATGAWGHINVDNIVFTDRLPVSRIEEVPGYGSMALTLIQGKGKQFATANVGSELDVEGLFAALDKPHVSKSRKPSSEKMIGAIGRKATLEPHATTIVHFVLSWWFPHYNISGGEMGALAESGKLLRAYAKRFDGADAVANYVAEELPRLVGHTHEWNKTWYDSTLPYWFLDRAFIPVNTLATQTMHAFDNGRWWAWEGVDCCPGTCQHVWQYAQSVARLFPAIERDLRERVDFGLAWKEDGRMGFRAENDRSVAHDGFCGTILRAYREHLMSPNDAFLQRLWSRIRKSLEFILSEDKNETGLLEGEQMNTLDAAWYGPMSWISSLYLGALAAGVKMATEMNDDNFAKVCQARLDAGRKSLVARLYNGEYFIHIPPDFTHTNTNKGCHSDQMLGQSMGHLVGLPRIFPPDKSKSALQAIWKYNFTPDVGTYRKKFKDIPGGRWYAMPGEGGMLVCTWPQGGGANAGGKNATFAGYFNECWTGFEYQVATQMVWEGMLKEGFAIVRTAHDRYHPAKRNPYNEVECSDHYSRAMSSYGVFLAVCGFEYDGPHGRIGFAPRLTPENFRAPFTAAEGWGTLHQARNGKEQSHEIALHWGSLHVKTLAFTVAEGATPTKATVAIGKRTLETTLHVQGAQVEIRLASLVKVTAGQTLKVVVA